MAKVLKIHVTFFLHCPIYSALRTKLLASGAARIVPARWDCLSEKEKVGLLQQQQQQQQQLCFELRESRKGFIVNVDIMKWGIGQLIV